MLVGWFTTLLQIEISKANTKSKPVFHLFSVRKCLLESKTVLQFSVLVAALTNWIQLYLLIMLSNFSSISVLISNF